MNAWRPNQALLRLRTLCCSGIDLTSMMPDVLHLVGHILPNAAGALFLMADDGTPQAFYHQDSPEAVRQLFQREPQLFVGQHELNIFHIATQRGEKAGLLLQPPAEYFHSNTYQLLVRASGHQHALEVRLDRHGICAGVLMLFREQGKPFRPQDCETLKQIGQYLEYALSCDGLAQGDYPLTDHAMVVCTPQGQVLWMTQEAAQILERIPQFAHTWQAERPLPDFCLRAIAALQRADAPMPCARLVVAGGYILVRAQWLHAPNQGLAAIGLSLQSGIPMSLALWRVLAPLALSPQQLAIAHRLTQGQARTAIRQALNLSEAVFKDAIKQIYAVLEVNSQESLLQAIEQRLQQHHQHYH